MRPTALFAFTREAGRWTMAGGAARLILSLWFGILGPAAARDYGPIRPGETLWQVADRVHPGPGFDRNQVMLALLNANPTVFKPSCNVNGILRVDAILRIPTRPEFAAVDAQTARRSVAQQTRAWAAHRRGRRPLDCAAIVQEATAAAEPIRTASSGEHSGPPPPAPARATRGWRIGYIETKPFSNYAATLANIVYALRDTGIISEIDGLPYRPDQIDTRGIWDWLARHDLGPQIEFVADAYYSYQGLKGAEIDQAAESIVRRLRETQDIDLMIAMGTEAGKTMATGAHTTPVLVFSTSNAVQAGIIQSVEDPGKDNVWAHVDPYRYRRQLEIFHDIFHFKRLGIAYEDSQSGRTFAAVADVEAVAQGRGFEIVRERVKQPSPDHGEAFYAALIAANRRLADQVDAVYFGLFIGMQPTRLAEVLAPFVERKVPVFAQQAPDGVRYGALVSVARANFQGIGRFGAGAIAKVMQGTKPRHIGQVYENSANILLNLQVAREIDYRPSFEILLVADEVFQQVERGRPTDGQ